MLIWNNNTDNMAVGPKAIIHLDRLRHNYNIVKTTAGGRRMMAVVKANGYGHGAVESTKALAQEGCDFFAVFTFEEAVELRDAGIEEDIFVFSRSRHETFAEAVDRHITLNISHANDVDALAGFHAETGESPKVHLKVDTGMTRLGITMEEVESVLKQIKDSEGIRCEGIYSHYATADEGDLDYANEQLKNFNAVLEIADSLGIQFSIKHFSNSGSVLNLPESGFDAVRVGMLLYGAFPSDEVPAELDIKPVMEFRGPIVHVRRVSAGTQVSYGGVWTAEKETTIGVIQTGFADGFPRPWYAGGCVSYRGNRYPIAGRVCMDQLMVDFGDASPNEGEDVLFFGENETDSIRVEEIASAIGSTPYVLLTAIHGRTERKYFKPS